jgi:hypothetical protein
VGFWRLGDTSGTRALDSASDPHNGSYLSGVTLRSPGLIPSDAVNTAVTLDGVNDSIRVPNHPGKSPTGVVSVEAWITPRAIPATGAFASVFSKSGAYSLQFNGTQMEFTIIQSGGIRRRLQAAAGALQVGVRYHVVGVYDGVTQRLYVNGVEVGSRAQTGPIVVNSNQVYVGSWDGTKEFFNGTVDEVAIYAQGLSTARVKAHYDTAVTAAG